MKYFSIQHAIITTDIFPLLGNYSTVTSTSSSSSSSDEEITETTTEGLVSTEGQSTYLIKSLYLTNVGSADTIDVILHRSGSDVYFKKNLSLANNASTQIIGEPIVLQAGDCLAILSSIGSLHVILSGMQV